MVTSTNPESTLQQAINIFQRLNEVEKTCLRRADTDDRIAYLSQTGFNADLPLTAAAEKVRIITEVKSLCDLEFVTKGASMEFGRTWMF
jgi:hypothetical protein